MATTSANTGPQYMTPEIAALVAEQVEAEVAARLLTYHNKAVVRGKPVVPVTLVVGEVFGVCEAFLIQQIHFWCVSHGHLKNGHKWSRNTYAQWAEQLRMFSERSVERALKRLVKLGVVVTGVFNTRIYDRTLWYRLDYQSLCKLMSANLGGDWEVLCPDDASLSITEREVDCAANTVASEPTLLAPPIPEIPEQPENKKQYVLSKQSAKLTAKPQALVVKTGTAGEEKIEQIENNLKVLGEAAPGLKGTFVNKPVETVKTVVAPGWMNAGKPLPEKLQKVAERAMKAVKAEAIQKEKQAEVGVHCITGKPMALATYWQSRIAKLSNYQKPLTLKEIGMLKKLGKDLGDEATTVIDFALDNWWKFAQAAQYKAGLNTSPTDPNIGFLLKHHAVAVNLHTIATTPAVVPNSTPINTTDSVAIFWAEKKKEKDEAFKLTPAQIAKQMEAMEPDGDLDKFWAEIELEKKNEMAACEQVKQLAS